MKKSRRRDLALACVAILGPTAAHAAGSASAAPPVAITEWPVPWPDTRPRDPYVAPDGAVWLVGQRGDYVARFDPESEAFRRFDLADGARPHTVIVDASGIPWYAANRAAHIGKVEPSNGEITRYAMPDPAARDPHTMTFGTDGAIWFTVQGGNFVGRLDPASGAVELVAVPTARARPYGIVTAADGTLWVVLFGTNKLARVDPATRTLAEIELPRAECRPRRLGLTSDGAVWYTDYAGGFVGRYDPATGAVREWPTPAGAAGRPYALAVDDADRIWWAETGPEPNRLVGFDSRRGEVVSLTEIASGAGAVRQMVFHSPTRALWFGTDAGTLARAVVP
jgi:virginiamycin B lyase